MSKKNNQIRKIAIISDPPYMKSGFGTVTKSVMDVLIKNNYKVTNFSLSTSFDVPYGSNGSVVQIDASAETVAKYISNNYDCLIGIYNPTATYLSIVDYYNMVFINSQNIIKIGYFEHEAVGFPKGVMDYVYNFITENNIDLVMVDKSQNIFGFKDVSYIPHGIDFDYFKPSESPVKKYATSIMTNTIRKRWDKIILGIERVPAINNYYFITDIDGFYNINKMLGSLSLPKERTVNINITRARDMYNDVLKETLIHVEPTDGEGFALPVAETLAYAIPNVATDLPVFRNLYGDNIEYIKSEKKIARDGSVQFEPDTESYIEKLKLVYDNWDVYRNRLIKNREELRKKLGLETFEKNILNLIRKY